MKPLAQLTLVLALGAGATSAIGAETVPAGSATCSVIDRSKAVALLACPADLSNEALREAGMAACHPIAQCRAWVWVDRSKIPDKAPEKDADIPESARAHAVAIWVNESQGLITLRRKNR
jgi:hypothetical protein